MRQKKAEQKAGKTELHVNALNLFQTRYLLNGIIMLTMPAEERKNTLVGPANVA